MATRKPTPESSRTRALAAILQDIADGKKVTRKEAAQARSKRWDGADEEAFESIEIAASMGRYTLDEKRKLIADHKLVKARLRVLLAKVNAYLE